MATYTPTDLWHLWKAEQIPHEAATGHLLQNLVTLHQAVETQRMTIVNLQADVARLIVHTGMPPTGKGKTKATRLSELADPE